MALNFVSVSAVSEREQLTGINRICNEISFYSPVAIGYQLSNKSINLGTQNSRQPRFAEIGDLSKEASDYGFIPAIHYYTKDNETVLNDLEKIISNGVNSCLSLLQFNTLPLPVNLLREIKKMGWKIIFKVAVSDKETGGGYAVWKGENVQDVKKGEISPLINQVLIRQGVIDYVMFDPSHGTNLDLDLEEDSLAIRFGKAIMSKKNLNEIGLVYAGGIKPSNAGRITKSLYTFFPRRISIDTESGVRTNDRLDLNLVRDYFIEFRKNSFTGIAS